MTGSEQCGQCGASRAEHDPYGFCPDKASPVSIAVGVVVRRWIVPCAAVLIAAVSVFTGGYYLGHNTARGCTYGALKLRNGDAATSSVPGVDAECDNGVMIRYVPSARPTRPLQRRSRNQNAEQPRPI